MHLALGVLRALDHTDVVVRNEVRLDGPGPLLEAAFGEHRDERSDARRIGRRHVDGSAQTRNWRRGAHNL